MLLLAVVALHLYRAVKARKPDEPLVVAVMGVYGPVGMALITVAQAIALTIIAGDFADRPSQTLAAAEDALKDPALLIPRYVGISAALALGVLAREGLARRDESGAPHALHGRVRDRAGPGLRASVRLADPAPVADRAGRPVRRAVAGRPPTRVGVRRGVAVA